MKKKLIEASIHDVEGMDPNYLRRAKSRSEEKHGRLVMPADMRRIMELQQEIMQMQDGYEEQLTEIGLELIMQYYESILDGVELDAKIVKPGDEKQQKMFKAAFDTPKPKKLADVDKLEIDKRKLMNNVLQGEGQNLHAMMHEARDKEIEGFDMEEYIDLCDEFLKITTRLYWWDNPQLKQMINAGATNMVQVGWKDEDNAPDTSEILDQLKDGETLDNIKPEEYNPENDGGDDEGEDEGEEQGGSAAGNPYIQVRALILPLLFHETVKGIYELIASNASLEKKKEEEAVQAATSSIDDELEDIKYGQSIATDLRDMINSIDGIDKHPNIREFIFGKMVVLPAIEFIQLMNGVMAGSPEAKAKLGQFAKEVIKDIQGETYVEPAAEVKQKAEEIKTKASVEDANYSNFGLMDPKEAEKKLKYMQQGEINFLLNKALDKKDWASAKVIGQYIKESKNEKFYPSL